MKLVYGNGINDLTGLRNEKFYRSWTHMLERCYSPSRVTKRPAYVSEDWKLLSNYKQWYEENYVEGWGMGKNLLFPRNKLYSSETCLFIPQSINVLFNFREKVRELPVGVYYDNHSTPNQRNKYRSDCNDGRGKVIRKFFDNSTDAHFFYLEKKISVIDYYLNEDYNDRIKIGLTNWKNLLQEHLNNRVEFVP